MSREEWIGIAGIIIPLIIGSAIYLWRAWRWSEERELRRIYRKAAMSGQGGVTAKLAYTFRRITGKTNRNDEMRASLLAIMENKDFWRKVVLPGRIPLAQEREQCRVLLLERGGRKQGKDAEHSLASFYDAVLDGMESARSERWRSRADREFQRHEVEREIRASQGMVGLNEEQEPIFVGGANLDQVEAQRDRLRELLDWALAHDTESALHVAYTLSIIYDLHGQRNEALQVLRESLGLVLEKGREAPKKLQIRVLNRAAHLANKQAFCDEAEVYAEAMLRLSREVEQDLDVATALQRLGKSKYFRCDTEISRRLLEESLLILLELKPVKFREIAWVQFDLGVLAVNQNDLPLALSWLKKSLASYQSAKESGQEVDKNGEGTIRVNLAFVLHREGDWKVAHAQMAAAAEVLKGNENRESYYRWYLHFLGRLDSAEGDFDSAGTRFSRSWGMFRERGDRLGVIRSLLGFSLLAAQEKEWKKALMLLGAEEEIRKREFDVPFPPDWEEEKSLIETGARQGLGESAFYTALEKGKMEWKNIVEDVPEFLQKS